MTHIDPRDPLSPEGRRTEFEPISADPRIQRSSGSNWALVGGLAAALVLALVLMTMFTPSSNQTADAPQVQRPPIAQGTPAGSPPADPATTGSVPRQEAPARPAPVQPAPATPSQRP